MLGKVALILPKLWMINGFAFYIHVARKRPSSHSMKFWISKNRDAILAHNGLKLSNSDIMKTQDIISNQSQFICEKWKEYFGDITFYC